MFVNQLGAVPKSDAERFYQLLQDLASTVDAKIGQMHRVAHYGNRGQKDIMDEVNAIKCHLFSALSCMQQD